jgi:hypothetical protein
MVNRVKASASHGPTTWGMPMIELVPAVTESQLE